VPDDLRAALSALPAGHQYVEVDGDVVLVAVQSRVVVDGISRSAR
jgi:Ni/Co efflux regulator RcnB